MTSIEILIEQVTLEYRKYLPDWEFPNKEHYVEMHKQEIIEAWEKGQTSFYTLYGEIFKEGDAEQYYQETFKKNSNEK